MGIKDWHENERPREKLINIGPENLTDAELLAILIGSGTKELSAVDLAGRILKDHHHQYDLLEKKSVKDLMAYKGIGLARAVTLAAAFELGRRRALQQAREIRKIQSPEQAFELLFPVLRHLDHEEFWIIYLRKGKFINMERIAKGGLDFSSIDLRIFWKKVLDNNATEIIIAHNHPSGELQPSESDLQITRKIREGGKLLEITLLDHLIITTDNFLSIINMI